MAETGENAFGDLRGWSPACPVCRDPLRPGRGPDVLGCLGCGAAYPRIDGIWRLLPPDRLERFRDFLADYSRVRQAEGRSRHDSAFFLRLPDTDSGDPYAWQWRIRKRSFEKFCEKILSRCRRPSRTLDLGAGCGWLSHRLAGLGHHPLAIDLSVDHGDGLGAARHYQPLWPRAQAEFERLPVADGSVDLAVFNASFHYSLDALATLREVLRALRPGGRLAILDSPIYRDAEAGRRMVRQRRADFLDRFGTRSDSLPSLEFLTWDQLGAWAGELELEWETLRPWYGWKWSLAPWLAKLRGRREPARFAVLSAQKKDAG